MTEVQKLAKIKVLKDLLKEYELLAKYNGGTDYDRYCALDMAIKALSQEPCTDAVSREAIDKYIARLLSGYLYDGERERLEIFSAYLWELPSVTPSRHVDCEGAEHDGNGCLGYSHYGDDFPIEECLHCPKYTSYEEE